MDTPIKRSHLIPRTVLIVVVLMLVLAVGYYAYWNSFQPNIQVTNLQLGSPQTHPQTITAQGPSRISGGTSFSYTSAANGAVYLVFDNGFSFFTAKYVTVSYTAGGASFSKAFTVPAGTSYTLQIPLDDGQPISGTFTVSGGSGNDIDFSIEQYSCSQVIPFSFVLVNSGNANGYATVILRTDTGTSVYQNKFYVMQGQQLPVSGSTSISDCASHTLSPTVTQQKG